MHPCAQRGQYTNGGTCSGYLLIHCVTKVLSYNDMQCVVIELCTSRAETAWGRTGICLLHKESKVGEREQHQRRVDVAVVVHCRVAADSQPEPTPEPELRLPVTGSEEGHSNEPPTLLQNDAEQHHTETQESAVNKDKPRPRQQQQQQQQRVLEQRGGTQDPQLIYNLPMFCDARKCMLTESVVM